MSISYGKTYLQKISEIVINLNDWILKSEFYVCLRCIKNSDFTVIKIRLLQIWQSYLFIQIDEDKI